MNKENTLSLYSDNLRWICFGGGDENSFSFNLKSTLLTTKAVFGYLESKPVFSNCLPPIISSLFTPSLIAKQGNCVWLEFLVPVDGGWGQCICDTLLDFMSSSFHFIRRRGLFIYLIKICVTECECFILKFIRNSGFYYHPAGP